MAIQHILVVDDSATDRFFLTELLETEGYIQMTGVFIKQS